MIMSRSMSDLLSLREQSANSFVPRLNPNPSHCLVMRSISFLCSSASFASPMQFHLSDDARGVDLTHASISGDVVLHATSVAVIAKPAINFNCLNISATYF